jgi:hypothetical protein
LIYIFIENEINNSRYEVDNSRFFASSDNNSAYDEGSTSAAAVPYNKRSTAVPNLSSFNNKLNKANI